MNELIGTAVHQIIPGIVRFAPKIAGSLLSPFAETILNILGEAFNVSPQNHDEMINAISSDKAPEILKSLEEIHAPWLSQVMSIGRPSSAELNLKMVWDSAPAWAKSS